MIFFLISSLLLSQAFIIYCCVTLSKYHYEMDDPEMNAYEDVAQDEYVKEWNRRLMKVNKK